MPKVDINDFDRNNNNAGKESKRWKGLKQDSSGKYLVYVTDTSERLFEDLDSAVKYLKEAAIKGDIKKEAYTGIYGLFSKYIDDLLSKKITKKDGEVFDRAVNDAINYFSYYLYSSLLYDKIVTREDGELFDKVVSRAIEDGKGRELLRDNIITKEDGDLYNQAINQALKDEGWKQYLLEENIITQEDIDNIKNNQSEPKEALRKMNFKKEASKENTVVQRGQENLDGLKEVITRRKLVQTADGRYKVMESKRYNMKSDDSNDAKNKLRNIDVAKEQTEELPQEDAFKDVKDEIGGTEGKKQKRDLSHKTSALQYGPVGTCIKCHCQIYPPNTDMDYWFNRQLPTDLYCPVCGYGIGTPGNFNYNNAKMNEQSVDNLVKVYASTKKIAGITEEEKQEAKDNPYVAYRLMTTDRLTVYDPEFSELIDSVLEKVSYAAPWLLKLGIVTPDDSYYGAVIKKAVEDKTIATLLITTNIVKKDNPYFGMVLAHADPNDYDHIIDMGYVTKEELDKFLAF